LGAILNYFWMAAFIMLQVVISKQFTKPEMDLTNEAVLKLNGSICLMKGRLNLTLPSTVSRLVINNSKSSASPKILARVANVTVLKMSAPSSCRLPKALPRIVILNLVLPNRAMRAIAFN